MNQVKLLKNNQLNLPVMIPMQKNMELQLWNYNPYRWTQDTITPAERTKLLRKKHIVWISTEVTKGLMENPPYVTSFESRKQLFSYLQYQCWLQVLKSFEITRKRKPYHNRGHQKLFLCNAELKSNTKRSDLYIVAKNQNENENENKTEESKQKRRCTWIMYGIETAQAVQKKFNLRKEELPHPTRPVFSDQIGRSSDCMRRYNRNLTAHQLRDDINGAKTLQCVGRRAPREQKEQSPSPGNEEYFCVGETALFHAVKEAFAINNLNAHYLYFDRNNNDEERRCRIHGLLLVKVECNWFGIAFEEDHPIFILLNAVDVRNKLCFLNPNVNFSWFKNEIPGDRYLDLKVIADEHLKDKNEIARLRAENERLRAANTTLRKQNLNQLDVQFNNLMMWNQMRYQRLPPTQNNGNAYSQSTINTSI